MHRREYIAGTKASMLKHKKDKRKKNRTEQNIATEKVDFFFQVLFFAMLCNLGSCFLWRNLVVSRVADASLCSLLLELKPLQNVCALCSHRATTLLCRQDIFQRCFHSILHHSCAVRSLVANGAAADRESVARRRIDYSVQIATQAMWPRLPTLTWSSPTKPSSLLFSMVCPMRAR